MATSVLSYPGEIKEESSPPKNRGPTPETLEGWNRFQIGLDPTCPCTFALNSFKGVKLENGLLVEQPVMCPSELLKRLNSRRELRCRADEAHPRDRNSFVILVRCSYLPGELVDAPSHSVFGHRILVLPEIDPRKTNMVGVAEVLLGVATSFEVANEDLVRERGAAVIELDHLSACLVPWYMDSILDYHD